MASVRLRVVVLVVLGLTLAGCGAAQTVPPTTQNGIGVVTGFADVCLNPNNAANPSISLVRVRLYDGGTLVASETIRSGDTYRLSAAPGQYRVTALGNSKNIAVVAGHRVTADLPIKVCDAGLTATFNTTSSVARGRTTTVVPPSAPVPVDNGLIETDQTYVEEASGAGFTGTALWVDLYPSVNLDVQVVSGSSTVSPTYGQLNISVIDPIGYTVVNGVPTPSQTGTINGYSGGEFVTPTPTGAITLTAITGSLSSDDLTIVFRYSGGTGSFSTATNAFTFNGG
jgi:hypothetical protein